MPPIPEPASSERGSRAIPSTSRQKQQRPIGIVGGEFDQRLGHGTSMATGRSVGHPVPCPGVPELRNIAIISHVDHGKTTLVDAMLRQAGTFAAHEHVVERVMDSGEQERERGITILAKNASLTLPSPNGDEIKINIVDTPGHADFGGEVERGLSMVDGVLLLVDASEGPLPQTRFVLRKALEQRLPLILVVNKADRADARPPEVVDAVYDLFLDLDATEEQIEFPIVYASAKEGWATLDPESPGADLGPLFSTLIEEIPAPSGDPDAPLQARVTNLDASPYYGRLAVCRVHRGTIRRSEEIAWCRRDGTVSRGRIAALYVTEGLERVEVEAAGTGEIVVVAGMDEVTIGETIAALDLPEPLPLLAVDEPALAMTIGVNTSPLAGASGDKLTGRQLEERLRDELVGNVSIQLRDTEGADAWEVQGRGELQLAVLVETMRREGFELTVGKPQAMTREIDGALSRARRAALRRHTRGLHGGRQPVAGIAQGPHGEHGQPRHRLDPARLPGSGPWADRHSQRVPHRDPRHRDPALGLRGLRAVARGHHHPRHRLAGRRPARHHGPVLADEPAGARPALRRPRARRSTRAW